MSSVPDLPRVTVAICTRNRAELARDAVASVLEQLEPAGAELLVVDNGSTDRTAELVSKVTKDRPDVHYVVEEAVGLSHARNTALACAASDIVVFLDDDAVVEPGWLAAMSQAFVDGNVVGAGGAVQLECVPLTPTWLAFPSHAAAMLGYLDLGSESRSLAPPQMPVGCNMAVRRSAALAAGGYDTSLGHSGRRLGADEETELFLRMHRRGGVIQWVPEAAIRHRISAERLTLRYLVRRALAVGSGQARTAAGAGTTPPPLRAAVRSARLGLRELRVRSGDQSGTRNGWRLTVVAVGVHLGRAREQLRLARGGRYPDLHV